MSHTVVGIFDSASDAQKAVDQLIQSGFVKDNIDISVNAAEGSSYNTYNNDTVRERESEGGIAGFFKNLFSDDEEEAVRYTRVAERGTVVSVHTSSQDEAERAADILDEYGTVDVNERASLYTSSDYSTSTGYTTDSVDNNRNWANTNRNVVEDVNLSDNSLREDFNRTDSKGPIQVVEENLQVGKREVETGGVKVRSKVVNRPVEETLRLREERVWVDRKPVNRPATSSEVSGLREETIELTERAEVPVVSKEARVVEEISLNKAIEEHEETIRETIRKTEVDVEDNTNKKDTINKDVNRVL